MLHVDDVRIGSMPTLHIYEPPWDALGYINSSVSRAVAAVYAEVMVAPVDTRFSYVGASTAIFNELPRLFPAAPAASADLFLLPLHPWALCFANDVVVGQRHKDRHGIHQKLHWDRAQPPAVERQMDSLRYSQRVRMLQTGQWPRSGIFNHTHGVLSADRGGHTCPMYERAMAHVFAGASWKAAPSRHIWVFEFPHLLRSAAVTERSRLARDDRSNAARAGMGILLTQEDRMGDFRSAVARREVILVPFDAPAFFSFDATAVDDVRAHKTTLVAESSGAGVSCHRFDRFPSSAFACKDPALVHPGPVRAASARAVRDLEGGVVFSPSNRASHYGESSLVRKAALYNRSTFCVLVPGDSAMTPRLFSFTAAACIPVLTISVDFLPFRSIVPWANISVSVSAKALLAYHAAARANASKLPANPLAFLAEMSDERIRRMQEQLLHYRWAMAYRRPAAPSAVHSIAQELQEHVSQNPVRQS